MIETTVDSWSELIDEVDKIQTQLARESGLGLLPDDPRCTNRFWYRGLAKVLYTLSPSLYRYRNGAEREAVLYKSFSQNPIAHPAPRENSWERLITMQHYQVPTRLLDWTETIGVAAFFAVASESSSTPCIYILDALWLNKTSRATHVQRLPTHFPLDYEQHCLGTDLPPWFERPFAATAAFHNERIQRQRGCFTVHGNDSRPLEIQCPECLGRILLTPEGCKNIRMHLERTNITAFSLFPDFEGLAHFVKTTAGLDPPNYDESIAAIIASSLRESLRPPAAANDSDTYVPRSDKCDELLKWFADRSAFQPFALVDGPAGIGKTTFLKRTLIPNSLKPVVFFPHKQFVDSPRGELRRAEDILADHIVQTVLRSHLPERRWADVPRETLRHVAKEMIRYGDIIVVVDGLDELARTRDLDTARALVQDLVDFIGGQSAAKIIISCRDHILQRLAIKALVGGKERKQHVTGRDHEPRSSQSLGPLVIRLDKFTWDEVAPFIKRQLDVDGKREEDLDAIHEDLRQFLCIPIFLKLVIGEGGPAMLERLKVVGENDPKKYKKAALYEEWFRLVLEDVLRDEHVVSDIAPADRPQELIERAMEKLGAIAVDTLKRRDDCFDRVWLDRNSSRSNDPSLHGLLRTSIPKHLRILEGEGAACSFAHQSLREFILARVVAQEIKTRRTRRAPGQAKFYPLRETSSFDYVGAETYEFLSDLVDFKTDVLARLDTLLDPQDDRTAPKRDRVARWNNRTRNLFEMIGMLSEGHHVLQKIMKRARSLLLDDTYEGTYVSYRVKQNVARCLERIHPSAPMPYFNSVLLRELIVKKDENSTLEAYAIRGFQLDAPRPSRHPVMILKKEWKAEPAQEFKSMETFIVDMLLSTAEKESDHSMEPSVRFLLINVSFALIRWLPWPGTSAFKSFKWHRFESAFPLSEPDSCVATNVFRCLEVRKAIAMLAEDYRELVERYRDKLDVDAATK